MTISAEHPLRRAEWIWPDFYMYLHNHFAQFRWDIELGSVAERVGVFVTADKSYRMYVNGQAVCRGPARGYQAHWPFDEVDVAGHLRGGHNWISVEAYQPGCSTFQYLHQTHAGLLLATSDETLREALAAGSRMMRRSPGHRRATARYSMQIDFQEHLDLWQDDRRWITGPERPVGWRAEILPDKAQKLFSVPFGRAPWDAVEPRGIPLLREGWVCPGLPTVHAAGVCDPGYREAENVSWHWVGEGRALGEDQWSDAAALGAEASDGWMRFTVPATGQGRFHAIVIPAGAYVVGAVAIAASDAVGGEIIDVQHDQFFRDGRPHWVEPGEGCSVALGNRLVLRPGANEHEFYHPLGFGHVTVIARDLERPLRVSVRIRTVGYPFEMRGAFECSDRVLNDIHAACRRTQHLCALDAYMDTPWREQAQWWGDARVQARNTFYLDGDARLLARGIRSLAGQSVSGLTPGHAPTSSYWCVLPDFALTWILTLWDHHWQTGEIGLFEEMSGRVLEVLAYFDAPEARHAPTGLLRHDGRFWLFEDWADLPKDAVPTFLNLWYCVALRHLARLCEVAGRPDDAARWDGACDRHLNLTIEHCFDREAGALRPALDEAGRPYGAPSVHDQTLALMLGACETAHAGMMRGWLLPFLRGEAIEGAKPSAFWATYVLEQAIARGHAAEAVAFIRRRWEPMLATGTTWEDFVWSEESGLSACHAWSAHPSYHLVTALAGLEPTGPAWGKVRFSAPCMSGLDWVRVRVPAPPGDMVVEWRRAGSGIEGSLRVPHGVEVTSSLSLSRTEKDGWVEMRGGLETEEGRG